MSASAAQKNRERQILGIEIRLESSDDQESRISDWLGRQRTLQVCNTSNSLIFVLKKIQTVKLLFIE